jgi:hypothetical protein
MTIQKPSRVVACLLLVAFLAPPPQARAYNNREHERIPDLAYQIMNAVRRGEHIPDRILREAEAAGRPVPTIVRLTDVPPGADPDEWRRFIVEVEQAPPKLDQLLTDLPDPANSSADCNHAFPILQPRQLQQCRAGELPFAPERYWPGTRETDPTAALFTECRFRRGYTAGDPERFPYFYADLQSNRTGAVLGYYAQNVDDEVDDIHMWLRPTNGPIVGELKQLASKGIELGLTVILAPIVCFISLFTGDDCLHDAEDIARNIEPIQLIDSAIPGIGDFDGDGIPGIGTTTGVWHFFNFDHEGDSDFNDIPGLHYTDGGFGDGFLGFGRIDAVDYTIITLADLTGLSVNPDRSLGVQRYTVGDGRFTRRRSDWVGPSLGHVEFEPLDNLALYGWNRFKQRGGASGLGWVLHALGDAVEPHHTISATGWGHRPYEEQIAGLAVSLLSENQNVETQYAQARKILLDAFDWWRFIGKIQTARSTKEVPVRELVTALARETRGSATWAFKSGISAEWMFDKRDNFYDESDMPKAKALLERGTGATLAFLVKTAQFLQPSTLPDPCACPDGQAIVDGVCTACKSATGPDGKVAKPFELDGQCVATCPDDKPVVSADGACTPRCVDATTGLPCPTCAASAPYNADGLCVTRCPDSKPFAAGNTCVTSCPPGTFETQAKVCEAVITPAPVPCGGQSSDRQGACVCPPDRPFQSNGQCVAQCPQGTTAGSDNVCRPIIVN